MKLSVLSPACKHSFRCDRNTNCISLERVCNGHYDCEDKTDEIQCSPPPCNTTTHFHCADGSCINKDQLCDGVDDCASAEDESSAMCGKHKQPSNCYVLLRDSNVCDTYYINPTPCNVAADFNCTLDQFKCQNNASLCLNMSLHCDGIPHCPDHSDEINCE